MPSRREYPPRPIVAAGALVVHRGKVLLVKRKNPPNQGRWTVPGGLVELGESVQEAAAREADEELGIKVKVGELFEVVSDVHLDHNGRVQYHFVIIDYLARPVGGKVRLSPESSAYGWFSPEDVKRLDMPEMTRGVVLRCLRREPLK